MATNNAITTNVSGNSEPIAWSFWLGLAFFIAVFTLIVVGGWRLFDRMMSAEAAPITTINVSGEMPFTNREDIAKIIDKRSLGNFFQLDVNELQNRLESLPWVRSASVRKQWPNQLSLYVVDHVPTATWNSDSLLSKDGHVFQADLSRLTSELPHFYGPEGAELTTLENYQQLRDMLALSQLNIAQVELTARYAWKLTLTDGVILNLGREDGLERIQRFIDVYPEVMNQKKENQEIEYVDLRYDTGLAVGWKQVEDKRV